jgi:two-component system response regulator YesN
VYRVFLAEDEIVVREGIRNSVPWDSTPYSLVGEAPDGELALSIIKDVKPDILITDIKMPFMDGLALARLTKQMQPWVKIIIISGHDEFQYAKQAISIGVEEFLLKPVTAADLLATLDKVAALIDREKVALTDLAELRRRASSSAGLERERWLADFVAGLADPVEAIAAARRLGIDLVARGYLVAVAEFEPASGGGADLAAAKLAAKSLAEQRSDVVCFPLGVDRLALLIKGDGAEAPEETAYALGQEIKCRIEREGGCRVSVGIGAAADRISEVPRSYRQADAALKHLAETGQRHIVGIGDLRGFEAVDLIGMAGDPVGVRLAYVKRADVDGILDRYADLVGDRPASVGLLGYYLIGDLIVAASKLVEELGGDIRSALPGALGAAEVNGMLASSAGFRAGVRSILEGVIAFRDAKAAGRYRPMIEKALRYIDANFADPDISLHRVAAEAALSPNHFSTVFAQETGRNFIEHLTAVRIERAKQLLMTTDRRSADVAYDVGFGDPHYFSFIFKKCVGASPRDFRAASGAPPKA